MGSSSSRTGAGLSSEAERRGYVRLSLETGSSPFFVPARALYAKWGFEPCAPFADCPDDPNSVHLTRLLPPAAPDGGLRRRARLTLQGEPPAGRATHDGR